MKFKPVYLYGIIAITAIALLLFVTIKENSNPVQYPTISNNEQMPNDEVHKQLMNQGSNSPGKQNVSEEYRKKLTELENAVKQNPSDTIALRQYADYLSASHRMSEAIPFYKNILEVNPKRSDVRFSLAIIYFNIQEFDKCREENEKVLTYDSQNQMALYNLGAISATQGFKDKAKEYWNTVLSINAKSETGVLAAESLQKIK